jgi:glycosyltransferase involved in cell wall biosynthesis
LATRMGGLPEIVDDGVTGWLVEPHPEAMADGLERAFEEAPRLRQNARAAYERLYTPELNHDLLMQAYAQAVAAKKVECAAMEVVA